MKKLNVLLLAGAATLAFQACNSSSKSSTDVAQDSNATKDTSAVMASNDTVAKTPLKVGKDDADFVVEAANGGMAEVALGKLAQTKATNAEVKAFGAKMITDHTKANEKLMAVAKQKNITLPATIGNDQQELLGELSKKNGADFDKAYVKAMVEDHDKDVKMFEKEAKDGKDTDVKSFAATTLPVLKMHQSMIKSIDQKIK